MAKLKGIKRVNRIINEFTAQFGIVAKFDTEFEAFCDDMTVGYTLLHTGRDDNDFIEHAQERYPEIQADIFLWAFFHEIGHCMTENMWTEEERDYFWKQKDVMLEPALDRNYINTWYYACPDEFFATRWAGEYMMNHPKKVAKFWNELQPAIMRFYRKNGLIEEN